MAREKTPPWVYIGCGCVAMVGLAIAGVTVFGFLGVQKMQSYVEDLGDPQKRSASVARVLGARELPAGYNAQFYVSVPFVFDMAILSDAPAYEGDFDENHTGDWELGDRGFVFMAMRDFGDDRARARAQFESEDPDIDLDELKKDIDVGIDFRGEEILGRGSLEIGRQEILHITRRGELRSQGDEVAGLYTQVLVSCPDDNKLRLGWWYQADESLAEAEVSETEVAVEAEVEETGVVDPPTVEAPPVASVELDGETSDGAGPVTTIDYSEDAVRAFFSHFNLCSV